MGKLKKTTKNSSLISRWQTLCLYEHVSFPYFQFQPECHCAASVNEFQSGIHSSKPPHYAELRLGLSAVQHNREGEKQKEKERIENERRSCCSIELCLIGRAQEVWVTHSKINTLAQRRAGTQNERMAGLLIRSQAEGTWILTGQQHVVAWWQDESKGKDGFFLSNCSAVSLLCFFFTSSTIHLLICSPVFFFHLSCS